MKNQQILQPIGSIALARSSTSSLSPHGAVLRTRSMRTASQDRLNNLKRGSIRGIQSILTPQLGYSPYGMDGRSSPAPSFATSTEVRFQRVTYTLRTRSFPPFCRVSTPLPPRFLHRHSGLLPICLIRSSGRRKKTMHVASTATIPFRRMSVSQMRSLHSWVRRGPKKVCSAASSIGNLLESAQSQKTGRTFSSSYRRAN